MIFHKRKTRWGLSWKKSRKDGPSNDDLKEVDMKEGEGKDELKLAKKKGKIVRVRTIKPTKGTYQHVGVLKPGLRGPRGGKTVAGPIRYNKKEGKYGK